MISKRQRWADFICHPSRPTRYLSGLSDTVGITVQPISDPTFVDFVNKLAAGNDDGSLLIDALDYAFGGYHDFLDSRLKALLRSLSNTSGREQTVVGPAIKGTVDWPRTLTGRATSRLPEGRFVVGRPFKSFDLPENRLLSYFLLNIVSDINRLTDALGSGALIAKYSEMRRAGEAGLRDFNLRKVSKVVSPTSVMLNEARSARDVSYRELAALVERREAITSQRSIGKLEAVLELVRTGWLAPVSDDNLFEVYALAVVLDVLANECGLGQPTQYGLVTKSECMWHVSRQMVLS